MMFHHGTVEDINDPDKLGRIKVRVGAIHKAAVLTEDLSWSLCISPVTSPAIGGVGHTTNILVGSIVVGIFSDNTMQDFLVLGTISTSTNDVKDNNLRARGEDNPNADQTSGYYEPVSSYAPEYPYNNVYETESGHVKEYDDTPGNERISERHKSGTLSEIHPNGTKVEKVVRDKYTLVLHDDTLEVHGNVNIIVSENCNLTVGGYLSAAVNGDIDVYTRGNAVVTTEADAVINAKDGVVTLDTPTVNMTGELVVANDITSTSGDVIATTTSLKNHVHSDGNSGDNTGPPV